MPEVSLTTKLCAFLGSACIDEYVSDDIMKDILFMAYKKRYKFLYPILGEMMKLPEVKRIPPERVKSILIDALHNKREKTATQLKTVSRELAPILTDDKKRDALRIASCGTFSVVKTKIKKMNKLLKKIEHIDKNLLYLVGESDKYIPI